MADSATQQASQYGSTDSVINYCEFDVSIVRQPSIEIDHSSIDYFQGTIINVVSIEIRESVAQFYRTATVTLADRTSFREFFPLTGNEIVSISYKNRFHSSLSNLKRKIIHFKIFHIEEYENRENRSSRPGSSYINLHLVEWPAFDFLSTVIYKTFPTSHLPEGGIKGSTLIEDLLKGINGFENHYDIQVDPCPEELKFQNFWIPRWNITKVLKFVNQFMISANSSMPYYFFGIKSNTEGLGHKPIAQYNSIYTFFNTQHFRTYSSSKPDTLFNKNAPSKVSGRDGESSQIPKPEQDKNFSPLDTIMGNNIEFGNYNRFFQNMLSGRTVLNYDYREGNSHISNDYRNFMKNYTTLGTTMSNPNDKNFGNQWNIYETVPFNNPQMTESYLKNVMANGAFKESFLTATCPLNETRTLAEKSALLLPSSTKERGIDYQMSGRWMTYSIVDIITTSGYATSEITFARDSFWLTEGSYLEKSNNVWQDQISEIR